MNLENARRLAPVRPAFTLLESRRAIMERLRYLPESKRGRALRRHLTPLDLALGEEQAAALDTMARAHLAIAAQLGAAPIKEAVQKSRGHSLPFGESDRQLIGAYRDVMRTMVQLPKWDAALRAFLASVEPDGPRLLSVPIGMMCDVAECVRHFLIEWEKKNLTFNVRRDRVFSNCGTAS